VIDAQKTAEEVTTAVENAWNTVRRAARSVSLLYAQGAATCQDVKTYNLLALAVYESQKAMLEFFRAQGVTGLPALPPSPTLFNWKTTLGKDSALLDCSMPLAGSLAVQPLPSGSLTVSTSEPNYMDPQIVTFDFQKSGLGLAPLIIYLVVAGVGFAAGFTAVVAFANAIEAKSEQKRMMLEIDKKAQVALGMYEARNKCMASCTVKDTNEVCFDKCLQLIPQVDVSPTAMAGKWDFWSLLGLGVLGAIAGVALYLHLKRGPRYNAITGAEEEEEDEDEDEDTSRIDVDVLPAPTTATWRAKAA
jgi:hypothetical protein